ncbi:hypothetical protein M406DRAFT_346420 [Cryphonectria parasitica EP155]|uniref:WD repeat protein n=1 Tax=Cryphonectria parasitica (strain ATCC 38755 / EP155) TaxID=660469 RepID=A0A9P4XZX1_CRYP1|nr:uncharacterized protein M406DRAFT_346420 [Cryphonectria parasitica EP155]KAF3764098.1 hypothetical protein M406DRAFT_346420 [Cryphonectria parasitica EP155]
MRRLLGKVAVDASPSPSSSVDHPTAPHPTNLGVNSSPYSQTGTLYRPSRSQDAFLDAGCPIDCLDRSSDGRSAILAGRHILKIVHLQGRSIQAGIDLRAAILAQPVVKNSTVSVADQLSIKDVKWLKGRGDTTIFTACANGKIFQYDLTRLGGGADGAPMEVIHMREDSRQINTLDINPRSSKMLAGSQDGIVRCFDIMNPVRTHTGHLTFRAIQSFKCNAGGIQCLQWSPNIEGAFYFACGTDQGVVLKWDIRKSTAPVLRINAHDAACTSLAWHFDGDHLASAGWDKRCFVWDVSASADKRQKPKCTIYTPAPVADLAWRPGIWSATAQGKRAAQLAVTYDDSSRQGLNLCHVWDLARPTMPFKKLQNFDAPPSALLWHDQDLLWTVGHDGLFNQFDIAHAPKAVDQIPTSALAFSSHGEVMAFLDERPPLRRPHPSIVPTEMIPPSYSSSPTAGTMLSISRSDSDDEVAGSFLGARRARPKQRRAPTTGRSAQIHITTPPGAPDAPILALAQSIKAAGLYKTQQAMAVGRVPSADKFHVYKYLSTHYLETLQDLLPCRKDAGSLEDRVVLILHHYSKAAEAIGLFRLSQTWLLLAHAVQLLLPRRAQYHLDRRSGELERSERARRKLKPKSASKNLGADQAGSRGPSRASVAGLSPSTGTEKAGALRSLLSEEFESTSNAPTPLARPVDDELSQSMEKSLAHADHNFAFGKKLTPVQEGASFALPAPLQQRPSLRKRLDSEPISTLSNDSDAYASTEGYDFYDTETISKAIDVPALNGHEGFEPGSRGSVRRFIARQDSDESYGQMFSISSGSRQTTQLAASMSAMATQSTDDEQPPIITQTTMDSVNSEKGESHPRPDSYPQDNSQTASVDFLPWWDDPPYPYPIAWEEERAFGSPSPLNPSKIVSWALDFETRSSALNASAMVLLLRPLLRDDNVIDPFQATAILKQHHSRLMSMKLFTQAAVLRKLCVKGWPGESLSEWGDDYPAVFRPAQFNNTAAFICPTCHKPREIDRRRTSKRPNPIWQCERCSAVMAPCAICRHRDMAEATTAVDITSDLLYASGAEQEDAPLSTWWYCGGCGHGGHASCLQSWHSEVENEEPESSVDGHGTSLLSDGCCPFDGCGHACLPGKYRAESTVARTEEVSRLVKEVGIWQDRSATMISLSAHEEVDDEAARAASPRAAFIATQKTSHRAAL